jgi:virulence-associated protein VapD
MKTVERKQYKAINFDLVTKHLNSVFGEAKRGNAYSLIRSFLEKNGFEHRQWSGYRSKDTMTYTEVLDICTRLFIELPWLGNCAGKYDVTNIGREFDMLEIIREQFAEQADVLDIEIDIYAESNA